jgi:hypothetical protein
VGALVRAERHHGVAVGDDVLEDVVTVGKGVQERATELHELRPVERLRPGNCACRGIRGNGFGVGEVAAVELLVRPQHDRSGVRGARRPVTLDAACQLLDDRAVVHPDVLAGDPAVGCDLEDVEDAKRERFSIARDAERGSDGNALPEALVDDEVLAVGPCSARPRPDVALAYAGPPALSATAGR